MSVVIPSILTKERTDVRDKLAQLEGLCDIVQLDVVDGRFASPATWPYTEGGGELARLTLEEAGLQALGAFRYEVDLMVSNPDEALGAWADAGATRLVIHVESAPKLGELIDSFASQYGHDKDFAPDLLSIGLALSLDTDPSILEPHLSKVDYVQFMGIATIGGQGHPFDERVVQRVSDFHKKHPDVPIQVDGGVSLATAPALLAAGVSRLVVGSDLWYASDLRAQLRKLNELAQQYGRYE